MSSFLDGNVGNGTNFANLWNESALDGLKSHHVDKNDILLLSERKARKHTARSKKPRRARNVAGAHLPHPHLKTVVTQVKNIWSSMRRKRK